MSVLSKPDIIKHMADGSIEIDPFNAKNLSNTSYDVRLGKYFFRQNRMDHTQILNPFHEKSVRKMYSQFEKATYIKNIRSKENPFHNLKSSALVILVAPGETILAHTLEFIGGRNSKNHAITTEMRARSSVGRIGIGVCKCAGWGDIGYVNRWTMEITNFSSSIIPLPVGFRIAQIIFHKTAPIETVDQYKSKYQKTHAINGLKKRWKPEDMLPALYNDKDLGKFSKYY